MISFKYIIQQAGYGLAATLALAACSDWDDHYDAESSLLPTQHTSLWEAINSDAHLTQFSSLLSRTGYDQLLSTSQSFTVWAPEDNTYDYDALQQLSDSVLVNDFIKNHIARSNIQASGAVNQKRVFMLNKKMMVFNGNGTYTMQGIHADQVNIATNNGTVHKLSGKIPFVPNIYETLDTTNHQIDSISSYFRKYHMKELDKSMSVPGPAKNGELTYIDSVFYESNTLYSLFNAYINREDSSYTMLLPTNEAWNKAKATISKYYNYAPKFFVQQTVPGQNNTMKDTTFTVTLRDPEQLKDSMVNRMLTQDLFYNNNLFDNKKLKDLQTGQTLTSDSLISTHLSNKEYDTKIYADDAKELFSNATRLERSNGSVWLTDDLHMRTWTTWNPEIRLEAEGSLNFKKDLASTEVITIAAGAQNPAIKGHVSNNAYLLAKPLYSAAHPDIYFYLPNVRSTTYSVYVVFVPANITNANAETTAHQMQIEVGYSDASGKKKTQSFGTAIHNDPTIIDTLYAGDVTFPVAYYGTGDYQPYIRVRSRVRSGESYNEELRIDCIILRPKELADYLKEHPDYRYDRGNN